MKATRAGDRTVMCEMRKERAIDRTDLREYYTACNYSGCSNTRMAQTGKTRTKNTAEVPPPKKYFVVKNIVPEYECQKCGRYLTPQTSQMARTASP